MSAGLNASLGAPGEKPCPCLAASRGHCIPGLRTISSILKGPAFVITSLSWATAEVPLRLRIRGIREAHLDDPACSPHVTLVASAKPLLSCQVPYPKVPGARVQTSLGASFAELSQVSLPHPVRSLSSPTGLCAPPPLPCLSHSSPQWEITSLFSCIISISPIQCELPKAGASCSPLGAQCPQECLT